ncbi:hypothetical protein ABIA06_002983 [Bradyrhizobium yuanmingense]|uniref:hypothetical protein n=1 Tax=Bradyrhizobium yuanmingense TaxID=108015 RepID=UPI003519BAEA
MIKLSDQDGLSGTTVRRRLAENDLKPWRRDMWCILYVDGECVARMKDLLDLHMLKRLIPNARSSASTRPRPAHRRGASIPAEPEGASATIRSTAATAQLDLQADRSEVDLNRQTLV